MRTPRQTEPVALVVRREDGTWATRDGRWVCVRVPTGRLEPAILEARAEGERPLRGTILELRRLLEARYRWACGAWVPA